MPKVLLKNLIRYSILLWVLLIVVLGLLFAFHKLHHSSSKSSQFESQDTYVSQSQAAKSYSADKQLVLSSKDKSKKIAFLRFDLKNVSGKIVKSAKLSLYSQSDFKDHEVGVYLVPAAAAITPMTWDNKPSLVGAEKIGSLSSTSKDSWNDIELNRPVWTDGAFEVALVTSTVAEVKFGSLESSNIPALNLDTETPEVTNSPPVVTLSAYPDTVLLGSSTTLSWSSTNAPTSCVSSGDWSNEVTPNGAATLPAMTTAKKYQFTLTCSNASGSGSATVSVDATNKASTIADPSVKVPASSGSTGSSTGTATSQSAPAVTISSSPASLTAGSSTTLTWSATNSPTSCTASGDWSGTKSNSGSQVILSMTTVKTYSFTLTCTNASGSGSATAHTTVTAAAGGGGAGGGTTVVKPVVSIAASPSTIVAGNSTTISWSATNSPTSCTASGDWSGAKASSGSASSGTLSTTKTYNFALACSNSAGTGNANVSVVVSATASSGGQVVGVPYTCTGAVNNLIVRGTGNSDPGLINLKSGCTGSMSFDLTIVDGVDGVKVQSGAHDLNITSGRIICQSQAAGAHQDGVQVQGGTNVIFHNLTVDCPNSSGAGAFYIDGKDFGGINNVICDSCDLKHFVIPFIYTTGVSPYPDKLPAVVNSGVRNSILHQSPYQGNQCWTHPGPDSQHPGSTTGIVNSNNTCVP